MSPERRDPTHILTVELPLVADSALDINPLEDALTIVLALSRLATADALCDAPRVILLEVEA